MSRLLPVGAQTYSKAPDKYPAGTPQEIVAAHGAWVWSRDGRKWVDCVSGLGAIILGHEHRYVESAVNRVMGSAYPLPSPLEEEAAETLLSCLTWERRESVRFGKNGADVTGAAVRLARAVTGREHVAYTGYHGHHPWSMTEPPMNGGVTSGEQMYSVKVAYGDLDALREVHTMMPLAAFVTEPVVSASPEAVGTTEYWQSLRRFCDEEGVLLVIDEMVMGFRVALGGGSELYGIEPDLGCYGKAIANGYPLSAIVGSWDVMKRFEKDVFFSTTHGGEQKSLAAAIATMETLRDTDALAQIHAMDTEIKQARPAIGYPGRAVFSMSDEEKENAVSAGMIFNGYVNTSLAHAQDPDARALLLSAVAAPEAATIED